MSPIKKEIRVAANRIRLMKFLYWETRRKRAKNSSFPSIVFLPNCFWSWETLELDKPATESWGMKLVYQILS